MAQIFKVSTNTLSKASVFGAVFAIAAALFLFALLDRSPYNTGQGIVLEQPVPFSHDHHTAGLGIDCRYCHTAVETSSFAGIPPTATCMGCHSQIFSESEMLEPVRESFRTGVAIRWNRVHDLPDFAYFDHSIHVAKGVGCATCHGRIDQMPLVYQTATLQMEWCLECHRAPERFVRPREVVFEMAWEPPEGLEGAELVARHTIGENLDDCAICHR